MPLPLTELAHQAWEAHLKAGEILVDATAGNGLDTSFLARLAGPEGRVIALDLQETAIERTAARLEIEGLRDRVTLFQADHARLAEILKSQRCTAPHCVCFNLGYLPHGDHTIRTRAESTLAACRSAASAIAEGGFLSVIAYRGHPGAGGECEAVANWVGALSEPWRRLEQEETGSLERPGPVWWFLQKGADPHPR